MDTKDVFTHEYYDYIVVGAGTAGLTLAYRHTEDGQDKVLVIETGVFCEYQHSPGSLGLGVKC